MSDPCVADVSVNRLLQALIFRMIVFVIPTCESWYPAAIASPATAIIVDPKLVTVAAHISAKMICADSGRERMSSPNAAEISSLIAEMQDTTTEAISGACSVSQSSCQSSD